jgi:hypothetical protein
VFRELPANIQDITRFARLTSKRPPTNLIPASQHNGRFMPFRRDFQVMLLGFLPEAGASAPAGWQEKIWASAPEKSSFTNRFQESPLFVCSCRSKARPLKIAEPN